MYCLNMVFEVIQASQKITKVQTFGMAADKPRLALFITQMNILNMVPHVRYTLKLSGASSMRRSSPTQ